MTVPASAPHAEDVAYHADCGSVGRYPKRDRPQVVPAPITAPAEPVRISAPGESRPLMSDSNGNSEPPAAALEATASASPSAGPSAGVGVSGAAGRTSGSIGRGGAIGRGGSTGRGG